MQVVVALPDDFDSVVARGHDDLRPKFWSSGLYAAIEDIQDIAALIDAPPQNTPQYMQSDALFLVKINSLPIL